MFPLMSTTYWGENRPRPHGDLKIQAGSRPHPHLPQRHRRSAARPWPPGRQSKKGEQNHSTQDSHVVPHHGTNWAALRLTAQIGRDAVLSESYGRGYWYTSSQA
jgi:hypothetical protein